MKSEDQIRSFLAECEKVVGFGVSKGPCPMEGKGRKGCCAECSFPGALRWVLDEMKLSSEVNEKGEP